MLLVKRSQTVVCDDPASNGFVPQNGWADDYGKIYLYYPINEVCELLHCGRQKRWTRCGNCNMQILYPSKSRVVENQTVSTQNTMKRFRTPTSRNPVAERQNIEKRAL